MARKELNNSSVDTVVKVDTFTIAWPPELEITPIMSVKVTSTRVALVYKETKLESIRNKNTGEYELVPIEGYVIVYVVEKTMLPPMDDDLRYGNASPFCRSLLDVRLALQRYSQLHRPKKKTVTQKVTYEVDGEEE